MSYHHCLGTGVNRGTLWIGVGHVVIKAPRVMCPLLPTAQASHSTQDPVSQSEAVATPEIAHTSFPGGSSAANFACQQRPGLRTASFCRWVCYWCNVTSPVLQFAALESCSEQTYLFNPSAIHFCSDSASCSSTYRNSVALCDCPRW